MIGLKKYVCMTVLMLCFVSFSTFLLGGNCCSCCCGHEDRYCYLCLEQYEGSSRRQTLFCPRCEKVYSQIKYTIEEIHPKLRGGATRTRPGESEEHRESSGRSTPPPRQSESSHLLDQGYTSPSIQFRGNVDVCSLGLWIPPIEMCQLLGLLQRTRREECTCQFLLDEIQRKKDFATYHTPVPCNIAQLYMAGMYCIGSRLNFVGREMGGESSETHKVIERSSEVCVTDIMMRSFYTRIRILAGVYLNTIDPILTQIWLSNSINPRDAEYLPKLLYESALGWPCFQTDVQANLYNSWMPHDMFEVRAIYILGQIQGPACWIVAPSNRIF